MTDNPGGQATDSASFPPPTIKKKPDQRPKRTGKAIKTKKKDLTQRLKPPILLTTKGVLIMLLAMDNFEFKGFDPSDELKRYCKEIYSRMEDKAPSESTKKAFVIKTKSGYEGVLRITSASGVFKADSKKQELKSLIDELYKKMSLQILDWSKSRVFNHTKATS